jgi:hypothetical protein
MSDDFTYQLSVKIDGQHLLNIRSDDAQKFSAMLRHAVENAEQIQAACAALEGSRKPAPAPPAAAPRPAPSPVPAASYVSPQGAGEVGPVLIKAVSKSSLKKDGTPMRSPKFTVEFSNGKKLSTFDATLGQSAEALSGQSVFYSTTRNGDYENLAEVRRAS